MKDITLTLTDYQIFNIASLEFGRFLSEDATPDECLTHLKNINVLSSNLTEELKNEFDNVYKVIISNKDCVKHGIVAMEKYKKEVENIFKM